MSNTDEKDGLYCVIGEKTGKGDAWPRRWFGDEDGAVKHAAALTGKSPNSYGNAPAKLFVAKIVKVVTKPLPPVDVRDPKGMDELNDVDDDG